MTWLLTSGVLIPIFLGVEGLIVMLLLERVLINRKETISFRLGLIIGSLLVSLSILGSSFVSSLLLS